VSGRPYTIYGYKGKQVRDNIHSYDLVNAFWHFFKAPRSGAVYNMGGSRHSNCSMIEAIQLTEELSGKQLQYTLSDDARSGDHIWWISDVRRFKEDFSDWTFKYDLRTILTEIVEAAGSRSKTNHP
jgi:CDP-paratose 2-epimerase